MTAVLIDPRDETPSLRRAAVLLARVRQDGGHEEELEMLEARVGKLWRTVADGHFIRRQAIDEVEAALARVKPPHVSRGTATVHELLLENALIETRELLGRLRRSPRMPRARDA